MPDVQIPGFPVDDYLWKIENIDHLDIDIDDQAYVNVYLVRLNKNTPFNNALNNKSLFGYEARKCHTKVVRIRIGYLHRLIDGAVYKNGLRIYEYINKRIEFSFDPSKTILLTLAQSGGICLDHDTNQWEEALSNSQLYFAYPNGKKGKWVVILRDIGPYSKIIIPSWAIFQRCYAPTHKVASQMIYGHIDKLVDCEKSGYLKESPTTFRVMLRSIVRDDDAHVVANLITDPKGKEAIDVLKKNNIKLKNSIGTEDSKVSLKAMFPYSNEIDIEVYGKELVYRDKEDRDKIIGRGFYVTEIATLETELMFNKIIPNRNNNNDKAEKDDVVLPSAYSGARKKTEGELSGTENLQGVNDDVSAYLDQLDEELRGSGGVRPKNLTMLGRDHKDYQYFVSEKIELITDGASQSNKIGVGDSKEKDTEVRGDASTSDALPPIGLDGFIEIIDLIQKEGIKCQFLAIQNTFTVNSYLFNRFNRTISGLRCYHLSESMRSRSYVIVEILYKERFSYLIEVEPKGKDSFACGLIKEKFFQKIDKEDFSKFMTLFIKSQGWAVFDEYPAYQYDWSFEQIKHSRKNPKTTADKIISNL